MTQTDPSKADKRVLDKMESLLEIERTLEEAVYHYASRAELKNNWQYWYENAYEHYFKKLERVRSEIANLVGARGLMEVLDGKVQGETDTASFKDKAIDEANAKAVVGPSNVPSKGHR